MTVPFLGCLPHVPEYKRGVLNKRGLQHNRGFPIKCGLQYKLGVLIKWDLHYGFMMWISNVFSISRCFPVDVKNSNVDGLNGGVSCFFNNASQLTFLKKRCLIIERFSPRAPRRCLAIGFRKPFNIDTAACLTKVGNTSRWTETYESRDFSNTIS